MVSYSLILPSQLRWQTGQVERAPGRQSCAVLGRCCSGRDLPCAARGPPRCFCDEECGKVGDCGPNYTRVRRGALPRSTGRGRSSQGLGEPGTSVPSQGRKTASLVGSGGSVLDLEGRTSKGDGVARDARGKSGAGEGRAEKGAREPPTPLRKSVGWGTERTRMREESMSVWEEKACCVQFQLGPVLDSCQQVKESPVPSGHQLLLWQAAGNPSCQETWERRGQFQDCSSPEVHGFVFI
ncbi:hypothetical protein R6Z07F_012683 [Ovis aries]